ncbi:peptide ABC transporter substrate-binding protein [Fusibacter bizertensis]
MKKLISLLLILVLAVGLFSGCAKNTDETVTETTGANGATEATKPATDKTLRIAVDVDLPSVDPNVATDGLSFDVIASMIEGLYSVDEAGNLIPALATDYTVSEDGLTYTFNLRDAQWSNGTPVTANDFVYGWRRLVDPATASEYSFIAEVAGVVNAAAVTAGEKPLTDLGVVAKDDKTLVVTLDRTVPYFLSLTAFAPFFPLNEAFVTEKGADFAQSPEGLIANGPYVMTEWNKGYGFKLVKNETYYDAAAVEIGAIDYRVIKDPQTSALQFDSNELDVVKLTAELVDNYKDNPAYTQINASYVWYASLNNEDPIFSNLNARKAFQHAVNKDNIVANILNDGSTVANYIVPTGLATGPDGKDFRETSKNEYGTYDVEAAQKYWETAKAELGITETNIEILFDDSETVKKMAEFIQAELEANLPGLTVSLKAQPKKNRLEIMREGDFQVGLTRWGPDYADPLTYLDLFLTDGPSNTPKFANAKYDELVTASSTTLAADAAGRWEAMKEAEDILLEQFAGIAPLYQAGYSYLINPKVTGIEPHAIGIPFIYKNVKIAD